MSFAMPPPTPIDTLPAYAAATQEISIRTPAASP
jgi:hypothetical protein